MIAVELLVCLLLPVPSPQSRRSPPPEERIEGSGVVALAEVAHPWAPTI
jgi:hypothetical protein